MVDCAAGGGDCGIGKAVGTILSEEVMVVAAFVVVDGTGVEEMGGRMGMGVVVVVVFEGFPSVAAVAAVERIGLMTIVWVSAFGLGFDFDISVVVALIF